jgi:DNA-directed RNA polymerase specialized sigma24 family protein
MLEIQVDTEGQITPVTRDFWDDLVTLADPHIRAGVGASACWCEEYEDCVQEVWVEVLQRIYLVDPDPMQGSLAGWLSKIARRTASRFLRRRAREVQFQGRPLPAGAQVPDPHCMDPAIEFFMGEEKAALAESVELLRTVESENAYRLVNQYLNEPSALACLPLRIDLGTGRFWHLWRKTRKFLQKRLAPFEQ